MKLLASLLPLIILPFNLTIGQKMDKVTIHKGSPEKQYERFTFGVHVSPLLLINPKARYLFGAYLNLTTTSIVLDLAYGNGGKPLLFFPFNTFDQFYGIRPEFRYHLPFTLSINKPNAFGYIGLEILVSQGSNQLENGSYLGEDKFRYRFDRATQKRLWITGIVKTGYQGQIYKSIYLDIFAGAGYGLRRLLYVDIENSTRVLFGPGDGFFTLFPGRSNEGNRGVLELALGFRIGFAL